MLQLAALLLLAVVGLAAALRGPTRPVLDARQALAAGLVGVLAGSTLMGVGGELGRAPLAWALALLIAAWLAGTLREPWTSRVGGLAALLLLGLSLGSALLQPEDPQRPLRRRAALDQITESPRAFFLGQGLGGFAVRLPSVNPADHGLVLRREPAASSGIPALDLWHAAGLPVLAGAAALLGWTAIGLLAARRDPATRPRERRLDALLLASLAVWAALVASGLGAPGALAGLLAAALLGVAWSRRPVPLRELPGPVVHGALAVVALAAAALALPSALADRHVARAEPERALAWQGGHPEARYRLLERALRDGDVEAAGRHYRELSARVPHYRDADALYGLALLHRGRPAEALERLRSFQRVDPFAYGHASTVPILAISIGDRGLLESSLSELLVHALLELRQREGRSIELAEVVHDGAPAIAIHAEAESLVLPIAGLAGLLLGSPPESVEQGRAALAAGLDGFLETELGARSALFARDD